MEGDWMAEQTEGRKFSAGGILALLGGALIVASAFLEWGKVSVHSNPPASATLKGDTLVLVAGIVLAILGIARMIIPSRGARVAVAILTLLASALATLITVTFVVSDDPYISTAASTFQKQLPGTTSKQVEDVLKRLVNQGDADVKRSAGVYLALGGSALGLIGGILGLRVGRKPKPVAPADTGWGQPGVPPPGYGQQAGVPPPQTEVPPPQGVPPPQQTGVPPPQGPPPSPGAPPPPPPDRGYSG
jgi:hypothetical protein